MVDVALVESLPGPVGFVFGGGGSLGAAQVGMLQAVTDHGIHADLVTGTSIGSINGAMVAADPIGAASRLSQLWFELDAKSIIPGGLFRRLWTLWRTKTHIIETVEIDALIERELGDVLIEDLPIPYGAMALDVATTQPTLLRSGRVKSALRSSSAIPGVFAPVDHAGREYYDGGLVVNVPVLEALEMGARSLVVFDCAFADQVLETPKNVTEAIYYSMTVQMRQQAQVAMPIAARSVPVVYLPGPPLMRVNPLDFKHSAGLIRGSYTASRNFLEQLRIDGPGLYRLSHGKIEDDAGQPGDELDSDGRIG